MNVKKLLSHILGVALAATATLTSLPATAADPIKVGLIVPVTGPFAYMGRQIRAGVSLYLASMGTRSPAGRWKSSSRTTRECQTPPAG
jgi:branched-chain amino acid transport system substrate-binding protein